MKRRSLLQRAAQLLGGGAVVAAGLRPKADPAAVPAPPPAPPPAPIPPPGDADSWNQTYQHHIYALAEMNLRINHLEDDIYGVFARRMGEEKARQAAMVALNIFGRKG